MNPKWWIYLFAFAGVAVSLVCPKYSVQAGEVAPGSRFKALPPIRHENLTIFPVISGDSHDTHVFLTLDEGLRSGEVVVTESGSVAPMVRPRNPRVPQVEHYRGGAQVNQLVLVNNSKRPLVLLAGEIVTGGK
jgi:hypothetical protein